MSFQTYSRINNNNKNLTLVICLNKLQFEYGNEVGGAELSINISITLHTFIWSSFGRIILRLK